MTNAATGSEQVAASQPRPAERRPWPARLLRPATTHWQFSIVVLAAVVVRLIVIVGYPPIMWFNDSYNYVYDAFTNIPDEVRPNGYAFFLRLFLPLHNLYPLALVQAAMGVLLGVGIYALLRRRGLPWWGAILPTLPVLFDSYELHLEHMVTADPLFIFLVTATLIMLCWNARPSIWVMALAGLAIGCSTVVRSVGEPLLIVVLVAMAIRRVGWIRLGAMLVAGIVPIAAYMVWFHGTYGKYAITESGAFLYSRVSSFADCQKINPPANLRALCDPTPTSLRPVPGKYVWADTELAPDQHVSTPLYKLTKSSDTGLRFTPQISGMTGKFAKDAILAQPLDYARAVTDDVLHTFAWSRSPDPGDNIGNGPVFNFIYQGELSKQIPWWAKDIPGDPVAQQIYQARKDFGGPGFGNTTVVWPWAHLLVDYQKVFYLRGPFLAVILLMGLGGVIGRWRRWGGLGLLPWVVGALLIVLPPMTAGFSYRYVLAAVPAVCLAAGLAFARRPGEASVGALAADLRRHLGRRVTVDQE